MATKRVSKPAPAVKAPAPAFENEQMVSLDPDTILADDNSRFGLKKSRIEKLAADILEKGGVMLPVEVEPSEDGSEFPYRLTSGFYRHAAVSFLNKEQNAGLSLPSIVRQVGSAGERLKRQLSENMERENQSPMDKAIAIKKLMDAGEPKIEIRKIFATIGGRKGNAVQPASNSFINMTLSFLDLPKAIQDKIHAGLVGTAAAYELTRIAPEKRLAVLERAESDRLAAIEAEEKQEEKFLAAEKKEAEQKEKDEVAKGELEAAIAAKETADKVAEESKAVALEAYKTAKLGSKDNKEKESRAKALKEAEEAVKTAEKAVETTGKTLLKLQAKVKTASEHAQERAAKLKEAREAAAAKNGATAKKSVGPADVKKAANKEGASDNYVALKAQEMKKVVEDLCLAGSFPKVRLIGQALKDCFAGIITDKQLYTALAKVTGEKK